MSSITSGLLCPQEDGAMQSIFSPRSPCSYFLFICLICLKQQTVRTKKSKFLRGCFWVCTDVFPLKTPVFIISSFLFFIFFHHPPHSFPPSMTWTEPYTPLILSLIHSSILTLMFHLHVPETDMCNKESQMHV